MAQAEFDQRIPGGKVWLWRSSLDSEVWAKGALHWKVWCWCLMRANWKDGFASYGTGRGQSAIRIKRGQFITGRRAAAEECVLAPNTVWRILTELESMGNVKLDTQSKFTVVTVCKYTFYQDQGSPGEPTNDSAAHSCAIHGSRGEPWMGTIEEGKNKEIKTLGALQAIDSRLLGETGENGKQRALGWQESDFEGNAIPPSQQSIVPIPLALDCEPFRTAWERWLAYHKARSPYGLTHETIKAQFALMASWGPNKAATAIEESIRNNWSALREPGVRSAPVTRPEVKFPKLKDPNRHDSERI